MASSSHQRSITARAVATVDAMAAVTVKVKDAVEDTKTVTAAAEVAVEATAITKARPEDRRR